MMAVTIPAAVKQPLSMLPVPDNLFHIVASPLESADVSSGTDATDPSAASDTGMLNRGEDSSEVIWLLRSACGRGVWTTEPDSRP